MQFLNLLSFFLNVEFYLYSYLYFRNFKTIRNIYKGLSFFILAIICLINSSLRKNNLIKEKCRVLKCKYNNAFPKLTSFRMNKKNTIVFESNERHSDK